METRANYILIGLFTLATMMGAFTFVYWFEHITAGGTRAVYRIVFGGPVSGLRAGAAATFNGLRVGEVNDIKLDPQNPKQVVATITIDGSVPVRTDTIVGLEFQGLTGISALALRGGSPDSALLESKDGFPPTLVADPGASQDVAETARATLRKIDTFVSENEKSFTNAVRNVETFTDALAKNSERVDRILAGVERLSGGPDKKGDFDETLETFKEAANSAVKDWHALTVDARRAVNTIEQVVRNFDRNPQRILFGGGGAAAPEPSATPRPAAPPRRPQQPPQQP